ncbi:hypothetical protein HYU95_04455 [Candidatus Daviesbacteria bacterium]|nr:hypothetical protein [Candidatus Daviesbacteria bacterium]
MSAQRFNQLGIFPLWLIIVIVVILGGGIFLSTQFKPWVKPSSVQQNPAPVATQTPSAAPAQAGSVSTPTAQQVKKGDMAALEKYCKEEALKLPAVPFTYKSKAGPTRSGPMSWVDQFIPKDKKQSEKISCTMAYFFDGKTAYGEMGAKYPMQGKEFDRTVRANLASKLDSSWKQVSGPSISSDSFNMVYKRENPQMGTVDFVDAFDGGLVIYVKFNTYYK